LQKNVPNNLKLVAANSVYDVGGTLAQPRKSIGGCPKMQARSLHGNRNTICFAALEKHNRDWRRPMIVPFPPNPCGFSITIPSPELLLKERQVYGRGYRSRGGSGREKSSRSAAPAVASEFEQRFIDRHMAEDYIRIYQQLLSRLSAQAAA
jgi:hypothetical protein